MNDPAIKIQDDAIPKNEFRVKERIHLTQGQKMMILMQDMLDENCARTGDLAASIAKTQERKRLNPLARIRRWLSERRTHKIANLQLEIQEAWNHYERARTASRTGTDPELRQAMRRLARYWERHIAPLETRLKAMMGRREGK